MDVDYRERCKREAALFLSMNKVFRESGMEEAETPDDKSRAWRIYCDSTVDTQFELDHIQQYDLREELTASPLDVPDKYWETRPGWGGLNDPFNRHRNLNRQGIIWVGHELKKLRNAEIEFWFKLVLPVVALVVSIIALVKKSH